MLKNIGKTIKIVCLVLAILATVSAIVVGVVLMGVIGNLVEEFGLADMVASFGIENLGAIINLVLIGIMLLCIIVTWIIFFFLYGYGTLVQESIEMRRMMEQMYNAPLVQQPGPEAFAQLQNNGQPTTF